MAATNEREHMTLKKAVTGAVVLTAIAAPAAQAHVTLQPETAPAGGFVREDVRVPNEQDTANTTKLELQLPDGFISVAYQAIPGWTVKVGKTKLAKPQKDDDGNEITEQVKTVTWTGDGKDGKIAPGQFQDFGLSVAMPSAKPGTKLTFKALQTYDNGDVVRWIGAPDADEPAPQVTLTDASATSGATSPVSSATPAPPAASTPSSSSDSSDSASKGLGIAALVIAIAGLLVAIGALATGRRRTA
jgi:uncharacterized protein YcnI